MDSGRGPRGTASDEDYEDGLYTDYSHSGEHEHEHEHDRYPYGIRRYLYDPQTPLHRLHLASFSDSEQYALVPGQMPSWRVQDGVESTHPLRRRRPSRAGGHRDGRGRRRRQSTSTILSSPSRLPSVSASSRSPSLVSLHPAPTSVPAAGSSGPDSREPPSSHQTTTATTTTTTPASCQPPPENAAADRPTGPEHDENHHALGHGDGPVPDGPDMSTSAATTDRQAAIWGHHHIIPDSGPFVIEGCGPYTLDTPDWDRDAAGIEYWTLDMIDAEFEAFEKEDDAAQ
ncbi:hypothetical protein MAC_06900 [Metarhizium acridum CQMa 102]|uniref:Uncharacterized protein n=1 Tax=Metarhizium acridum (strain CQMa 102) TaxID=655827 RepID=E9EAK2_METAQ|nr:uncharacterized protein MAC_06900 [Metarhizium acridum CQMa 102]EFY87002.1 hypothetical protein MAC_06900 [Metarhizium acridum CQMa 102]